MNLRGVLLGLLAGVVGVTMLRVEVRQPPASSTRAETPATPSSEEDFKNFEDLERQACLMKAHRVIATYPDPQRTGLALMADRTLEALQLAAGSAEYVVMGIALPSSAKGPRLGGILFRNKPSDSWLFMTLVGESPTSGVDFWALDYAVSRSPSAPLIGPGFTGSVRSLDNWMHQRGYRPTRWVSGSVTGIDSASKPVGLVLVRPYEPDVRKTLKKYWTSIGKLGNLVRIVESSTGFGQTMADRKQDNSREDQAVRFPWQISRLRHATPTERKGGDVSNYETEMALTDTTHGAEAGATYSVRTPNSLETVLTGIAERLDALGGDVNGGLISISTTDPLDSLFMTRFLRASHRNERVVLLTADRLYLRAADLMPVTGILSVATFPQLTASTWRGRSLDASEQTLVFDSEWSEGTYCAALAALDAEAVDVRCRPRECEIGKLWLSITGRDGFWPLALLEGTISSDEIKRPGLLWKLAFYGGGMVLLGWMYALIVAPDSPRTWCRRFQAVDSVVAIKMALLTMALQLTLAAVGPVWLRPSSEWWGVLAVFWALVLAASGSLLYAWARAPWSDSELGGLKWLGRHRWAQAGIAFAVPVALVVAAAIWAFREDPQYIRAFFVARSFNLSSGVSPMLPLLLTGIGWVAVLRLSMSRSVDAVHSKRELTPDPTSSRLGELAKAASGEMKEPPFRLSSFRRWKNSVLLLATGALAPSACLLFHSAEPKWYEFIYIFATGSLALATLRNSLLFLNQWLAIRQLLAEINLHPVMSVLEALPPGVRMSTLWNDVHDERDYMLSGRTVSALEALEKSFSCQRVREVKQALQAWHPTRQTARAPVEDALASLTVRLEKQMPSRGWSLADPRAEFIALRIISVIDYCGLQLRNRSLACIFGFAAIVLSLNSYPFGQERAIVGFLVLLSITLGAISVTIFAQMSRDAAMSKLTQTTAGKLDFPFVQKLLLGGALPVLSLLTSYSPAIGKLFTSLLQPAVEAMK